MCHLREIFGRGVGRYAAHAARHRVVPTVEHHHAVAYVALPHVGARAGRGLEREEGRVAVVLIEAGGGNEPVLHLVAVAAVRDAVAAGACKVGHVASPFQ